MPSRFGISKKSTTLLAYAGLVLFITVSTAFFYGYHQLGRYASVYPVEWAGEADSIQLQFDKTNPYSTRVIFVSYTPFGERMVNEYQHLYQTMYPVIQQEHHTLYSAVAGNASSMNNHKYLDYLAVAKLELAHLSRNLFTRKIDRSVKRVHSESINEPFLEPIFTRGLYQKTDNALVDHLRFLVQHAEPGSYIRFSVFLFYYQSDDEPLLLDLLAAAERGVNVQLITDLPEAETPQRRGVGKIFQENFETRLQKASNGKSASWIKKHADVPWDSKNHTKIFLFSKSAGMENWVIISSENLTDTERQKYQAGLVIRDKLSYDAFEQYWNQILDGSYKNLWFAAGSGNLTHYFFPQTANEDEIYQQLDRMKIIPAQSQQGRLLISMARWNFERFPLAMKLVELSELGIKIEIVTRNNPDIVDDIILKALSHRNNITLHTANVERLNIHSKYILYEGYYRDDHSADNDKSKKILWVGSHNFTGMAMRNNYETWSEVRNDKIFQAFSDNFEELVSLVPVDPSSGSVH